MFCSNCGKEIQTGANFCSFCGNPVGQPGMVKTDESMVTPNFMVKLGRLSNMLAQIEDYQYCINLCNYLKDNTTNSLTSIANQTRKAFQSVLHPVMGTVAVVKDEHAARAELKKRGIRINRISGMFGDDYEIEVQKLKKKIQNILKENRDLAGVISDRYLCSDYVNYIITMFRERRAHTLPEAYNLLDEEIHRNSMEQMALAQQQNIEFIRSYISGWWLS